MGSGGAVRRWGAGRRPGRAGTGASGLREPSGPRPPPTRPATAPWAHPSTAIVPIVDSGPGPSGRSTFHQPSTSWYSG